MRPAVGTRVVWMGRGTLVGVPRCYIDESFFDYPLNDADGWQRRTPTRVPLPIYILPRPYRLVRATPLLLIGTTPIPLTFFMMYTQ